MECSIFCQRQSVLNVDNYNILVRKFVSVGEQEDFPIEIVKRILVCGIAAGTDPAAAVNTKSNAVRSLVLLLLISDMTSSGLGLPFMV